MRDSRPIKRLWGGRSALWGMAFVLLLFGCEKSSSTTKATRPAPPPVWPTARPPSEIPQLQPGDIRVVTDPAEIAKARARVDRLMSRDLKEFLAQRKSTASGDPDTAKGTTTTPSPMKSLTAEEVWARINKTDGFERGKLLLTLVGHPFNETCLDYLEKAAREWPVAEQYQLEDPFRRVLDVAAPAARARCLKIMQVSIRRQFFGRKSPAGDRGMLPLFTANCGEDSVPMLKEMLHSNYPPDVKRRCLEALTRILGPEMKEELRQSLRSPSLAATAAAGLGRVAKGTEDWGLSDEIRTASTARNLAEAVPFIWAIRQIGSRISERTARRMLDDLHVTDSRWLEQIRSPDPYEFCCRLLVRMKIMSRFIPKEEVRRRVWEGVDDDEEILFDALRLGDSGLVFDTEWDAMPSPHDVLIYWLSDISRGGFEPEAVLQVPIRGGYPLNESGGQWVEPGYLFEQFILAGRLYYFRAEFKRDWFDVTSVEKAVNRSLADSGKRERFVGFGVDQRAGYLYGDPSAIHMAYALGVAPAWARKPAEATETGQQFEKQVLDQYFGKSAGNK